MLKLTNYWLSLTVLITLCLSTPAQAQPTRDRILGDLRFTEQSDRIDMQIGFNFPVRYVRHFPEGKGEEIRIQLKPIAIGSAEREGLFKREAISADKDNPAGVTDVIYEGDNYGGLMLTVYFSRPRSFSVQQGNDYRSILVSILDADPQAPTEK